MQLLTCERVGDILDVPTRRVYWLIREGLLPGVHLGRQVRVAEDTLQHFIKEGGARFPGGWRKDPGPESRAS